MSIQILQTLINVQCNDGTGKPRYSSPYAQHHENMLLNGAILNLQTGIHSGCKTGGSQNGAGRN